MTAPHTRGHETQRNAAYRRDVLWNAALLHRLSGVALAVFLPFHFLVLALALRGETVLDGFLSWTKQPLVKFAEAGLIFALAVHLVGGLRLMMLEAHGWRPGQRTAAIAGIVIAALLGAAFLIGA